MPRPVWFYYFMVDGIDGAVNRVREAGGNVIMGPRQVPGGQWILQGSDTQEGYFSLLSNTK
jgi:predicted enzyme related to lactoylglutathione lyase